MSTQTTTSNKTGKAINAQGGKRGELMKVGAVSEARRRRWANQQTASAAQQRNAQIESERQSRAEEQQKQELEAVVILMRHHVNQYAARNGWSADEVELAQGLLATYVHAGEAAPILSMHIVRAVRHKFVMTIALRKVAHATFPGQSMEWYSDELVKAIRFLDRQH